LAFLRERRHIAIGFETLQFLQPLEPAANRSKIREDATQPALVDVRHAARLGNVGHRIGRLALRPDKQNQTSLRRHLGEVFLCPQQPADRLLQVDDVNLIAATVNVRPHFGVPPAGPVPEVYPGFENILDHDF
jgi:hypothetical protein